MLTILIHYGLFYYRKRYHRGMMRRHAAVRYVWLSQLSLWACLTVCTILMPHFLFERNEGGVSNYGVHALTVVPYSLAFGLGGTFLLMAAYHLPTLREIPRHRLQFVLAMLGCLLLLVLLTTYPYKVNKFYNQLHIYTSTALFVVELLTAIWMALRLAPDRIKLSLFTMQVFGSALSLLTLVGVLHVLFISQFIVGVSFGALLVRTMSQVMNGVSEHSGAKPLTQQ